MKKLGFAILGCGKISKKHAQAIANNYKEAELIAVCDVTKKNMDIIIDKYCETLCKNKLDNETSLIIKKGIQKYIDYKDMLNNEEIDIITITTESGYHAQHTIDCLNSGKHVIVEKPMALSTEDADHMIYTAKKNNLKLAVCFQNRFNPCIQKLRKAVDENRFGKLVNGTARVLWYRNDDYYKQAAWRGTWKLDGGVLMNQCIHNIDLLQWMLGGEVDSIYAITGTFLKNIEAEDFGAIIIRFKNGTIGLVEGSVCVYPENLEETLSIFGEKGTVVIGGPAVNKIETWKFSDYEEEKQGTLEYEDKDSGNIYGFGHTLLFKDVIEAVKENREPLVSGEEGRKSLEIILAAYKSQYYSKVIIFPVGNISTMNFKREKV